VSKQAIDPEKLREKLRDVLLVLDEALRAKGHQENGQRVVDCCFEIATDWDSFGAETGYLLRHASGMIPLLKQSG
jgi:hypothetical protein